MNELPVHPRLAPAGSWPPFRIAASVVALAALLGIARVGAQQFTLSNLVDTTFTAPGHGNFTSFSVSSIGNNNVAYNGIYSGGNGIYSSTVGTTGATLIADFTTTAPGQGTFNGFSRPTVSGNSVAFQGGYAGGGGLYTGTVGTVGASLVADFTTTAPGQAVTFNSFDFPAISGATVAFAGSYTGGTGIYTGTVGGSVLSRVADRSTIVPGQTVPFTSFLGFNGSRPAVSGSNVAFVGGYATGSGVYTATVGSAGVTRAADTTTIAPGHGAFSAFSNPALSGNNLAFLGNYGGGTGIYTVGVDGFGLSVVVDTSTIAPGHGAFTFLGPAALNGNNLAFVGSYSGGRGIFAVIGGGLIDVVNTGDPLFGSILTGINIDSFGYAGNQITFSYGLQNGRIGVGVVNVIPEPSTWAMTICGLGVAGIGLRFRRGARRE